MNMRLSVADGHLSNMGRMIEEMESKLRNSLDQVIFFIIGFKPQQHTCIWVFPSFFLFCYLFFGQGKGLGIL